jgi:hypothetical protein
MKRIAGVLAFAAMAACSRAPVPDATTTKPVAGASGPVTVSTLQATSRREPSPDTRVLPQAFRGDDSLASLQERFGALNVRVEDIPGAEGEVSHGIVLFPDDPTRRAYLHFQDEDHLRGLALVRIVDSQSTWALDGDVRMGTTLAELVARNGAPIEFSGFGWDYGGAIAGFRGGKLEPRNGAWPRRGFRLSPRNGLPENVALPQGDATFSSDDPKYADLATTIVIGELTLAYPRAATQ